MKKYHLTVFHPLGFTLFDHSSDDKDRLVRMYRKEAYASDGNMFCDYYNASYRCNFDLPALSPFAC